MNQLLQLMGVGVHDTTSGLAHIEGFNSLEVNDYVKIIRIMVKSSSFFINYYFFLEQSIIYYNIKKGDPKF